MTDNSTDTESKALKIVFFGTPEFAAYTLRRMVEADYDVAAVVTMPDKRAGRGHKLIQSDVKTEALRHDIPVLQPSNLKAPEFIEELRSIGADLFVVIAFRMLPEAVWSMPELGTFNLHASLLPKYRGAAPINRAIMNGETESGVTTFFLQHDIDTGDIIGQRRLSIAADEDAGSLHDRLMMLGADMVLDTLQQISHGDVKALPQPEGEYIPAPKIFKMDCAIDWNKTSQQIFNHIRGLSPYPAAWSRLKLVGRDTPLEIKIYKVSPEFAATSLRPGQVSVQHGCIYVGTSDGSLRIDELQPAGKRRMDASAFLLGYDVECFIANES